MVAAVGGRGPGLTAAVIAPLAGQLVPRSAVPHAPGQRRRNVLSLAVFVSVAVIVSAFVSVAARWAAEAGRARQEAEALAALAGTGGPDPLQSITDQLQQSFEPRRSVGARASIDGAAEGGVTSSRPRPASDHRRRPIGADFHESIGPGVVLAASGPHAHHRRPSRAAIVHPAAQPSARTAPARGGGGAGRRARTGRRVADGAAASRVARPAHAARRHQGVGVEPAPARHRVAARGARRLPRDDRGRDRSAHLDRHQPARPEPPAGGRAPAGAAAGGARGGRARRRCTAWAIAPTTSSSTCPPTCPTSTPIRRCSSVSSPTWSPTRSRGRRPIASPACGPVAAGRRRCCCRSSTTARASTRSTGRSWCNRSIGSATTRPRTGLGLGLAIADGFDRRDGGRARAPRHARRRPDRGGRPCRRSARR